MLTGTFTWHQASQRLQKASQKSVLAKVSTLDLELLVRNMSKDSINVHFNHFAVNYRQAKIYRVPHNYLNLRFEFQPAKAFEKFNYA